MTNHFLHGKQSWVRYYFLTAALLLVLPRMADAQDVRSENFIFENFEEVASGQLPAGWSGEFFVLTSGGLGNSHRLTTLFNNINLNRTWQTEPVLLSENATLNFHYRVVDQSGYPDNATPAENFTIDIEVSADEGDSFELLLTIDDNNHVPSTDYAPREIDLSAYEGDEVIIRTTASNGSVPGFFVDFDQVIIGTLSDVTFTVQDANGPLQGAVVDITGVTSSVTDAGGETIIRLPAGDYDYTISETDHLTYSGNFTHGADALVIDPLTMISNYIATFSVINQEGDPVQGANVNLQGNAQGYNGVEQVNTNLVTNASGIVSQRLALGEYEITVTAQEHYDGDNSFVMQAAEQTIETTLQEWPTITFTVNEQGSDNPIEDASITLEGYEVPNTGVGGQTSVKVPTGNYSYAASKLGYIENTESFEVINNDDLALPAIALEEAPPTLEFVQPDNGMLSFPKTLTGQFSNPADIVFRNSGSDQLTVAPDDIILAGDNPDEFVLVNLSETVSLSTGEEATFQLLFNPATAGNKSAVLQITNDQKVVYTITLEGTAYDPFTTPFFEDFEDFEEDGFENWIVINGEENNQWFVGEAGNDVDNLSAIISNDGGTTHQYQINALSRVHFYTDIDIPLAEPGSISLNFDWQNVGEPFLDQIRVYLTDPSVVPLAGELITGQFANLSQQSEWQSYHYTIPDEMLGQTKRLVFTWMNSVSGGENPPAAIDNIYLGEWYDLVVEADDPANGSTNITSDTFGGGMPVELVATPAEHYIFTGWSAANGDFSDETSPNTTFTMPDEDVTVTASFAPEPPVVQNVAVDYDGTEHALTATAPGSFDVIWYNAETEGNEVDNPTQTNAGNYLYWAVARDANGLESERVQASLTIDPFPITITALDINKEEGVLYTFTGDDYITDPEALFAADEITGVTLSSDGAPEDALPGTYPIVVENAQGSGLSNYDITYQNGTMTVTGDMVLTFSGLTAADKEYDGTTTATITDWGTLEGIVDGAPDVALETTNAVADFSQPEPGEDLLVTVTGLQLTGADAGEYLLGDATTTASITSRAITIAADDADKNYGDNDPELTWQVTQGSLISNNDLTGTLTRETGEDAGTYDILQGSLELPQGYDLTFQPGVFTIHTLPVTIAADDQSKVYGDNDPELTWQVTEGSLVDDDHASGNLTREAGETPGTYDILQGTLALTSNYVLTYTGAALTITPRELTLTGTFTVEDKPFDGTTDANLTDYDLTLVGVLEGDEVQLANPEAVFTQPGVGDDITVVLSDVELQGADAGNYEVSLEGAPTTTASITQVTYPLTVVITPEGSGTVTGEGDYLPGTAASLTATPNQGYRFRRWLDEQGITLSSNASYNYTMTNSATTLTAEFEEETGVADLEDMQLTLYPNPAQNTITLTSDALMEQITITAVNGQVVYNRQVQKDEVKIAVEDYPAGIYFVSILTGERAWMKKIIVE